MTEMDGWKDRWTVVVESAGTVSCRVGVPGLLEVEETLEADELVASTISSCSAFTSQERLALIIRRPKQNLIIQITPDRHFNFLVRQILQSE